MVERKRLIAVTLLSCSFINFAQASAWLIDEGSWNLYYQNEYYYESEQAKNLRLYKLVKLKEIEQNLIELHKQRKKIQNQDQQIGRLNRPATHSTPTFRPYSYSGISSNSQQPLSNQKNHVEQAKLNRLRINENLQTAQHRAYNNILYQYLPQNYKSYLIEYGAKDYATIAVKTFNSTLVNVRGKELFQQGIEVAPRFRLMQNKSHVISIQPKISYINNDFYRTDTIATEWRILYGNNRPLRSKLLRRFNITHFTNLELAVKVSNYKSTHYIIGEITEGLKFKQGWQLLWQNFLTNNSGRAQLYKRTLREQLTIAKTFSSSIKPYNGNMALSHDEITLQLGYFVDYNVDKKYKFAEGIVFSLWLKM